jgi:hypothetical protein
MRPRPGYLIADEPRPGALAHTCTNPLWPFLALMLAGTGPGFVWFIWNALAMGSATRRREIVNVVYGLVGIFLLALGISLLIEIDVLPRSGLDYYRVGFIAFGLAAGYFVYLPQARSFELYTHFGGVARNGVMVLVAAIALRVYLFVHVGKALGLLSIYL